MPELVPVSRVRPMRWRSKKAYPQLVYGRALGALRNRYPEEFTRYYDAEQAGGVDQASAYRRARARLRDAHYNEFDLLLGEIADRMEETT